MNQKEILLALERATTPEGKQQLTIREYLDAELPEGLQNAVDYYEWATKGQKAAKTDFSYWMYEGDIAIAQALIAIFKHLIDGHEDFPPIEDVKGKVTMDSTAIIAEWANQVLSDHVHEYEGCRHNWDGTDAIHPKCTKEVTYGLAHHVCYICGRDQYENLKVEDVMQ